MTAMKKLSKRPSTKTATTSATTRRPAKKKQPEGKPRGRKPIDPAERMIVHPIRLKAAQIEKLQRIGGTPRLRSWLDNAKDVE